ncbi:MAG: hypothetical protein Q8M15_15285 [Bacteroidota bacterium]|nr:hypothetical protein [Bacteroidota bacterium]
MNKRLMLSLLGGFIYVAICFLPVIKSGLYADDLPNFQHRAAHVNSDLRNVVHKAGAATEHWKTNGRYTPVSFLWMGWVFHVFTTITSYKIFVYLMNMLAVLAFVMYLRVLKINMSYSIWLICFGSVIQFRVGYHDAYTSYNGMYQLLAVFAFATLIFHCLYFARQKTWFLIASAFCFLMGIFISEVGLFTLLLLPFTAVFLKIPLKKWTGSIVPILLITMGYLGYIIWLRMHMIEKDAYSGLKTSFDFPEMAELMLKQLYASLPLTNLQNKSAIPIVLFHQLTRFWNLTAVIGILLTGYSILKNYKLPDQVKMYPFNLKSVLFAVALMVLPALFILPSAKYQNEINWSSAYLPVYIQSFGTAMLLALLFEYGFKMWQGSKRWYLNVLMVFITCSTAIAFLLNNALINVRSYKIAFPAQVLFEAVKDGALNKCRNGSTIVLGNDYYWKSPSGYQMLFKEITGKDYKVYDNGTQFIPGDTSDCYFLDCQPGKKVIVTLHKMDCYNHEKKVLIEKRETDCYIDVIKEDGI